MSENILRFIHLSDIHFTRKSTQFGFNPDHELRRRVLDDIRYMQSRLGSATAVLVSGDVAYAGHRAEYDDAATWLDQACSAAGCLREDVLLCPGNHDIDQNVIRENPLIQDGHDAVRRGANPYDRERALSQRLGQKEARALFYSPLAAYNEFAARYQSSFFADEKSFVWEKDFRLNDSSILRIRGLNTALLSGLSDREGSMYLGPQALTLPKRAGVEYLTMAHHPPNWLLDKREAEQTLDADAKIQLFGHEHESRVSPGRDWVKLFAGAINPHRSEPNWRPGYNIIELYVEQNGGRSLHVHVHACEWQMNPPLFRSIEDRGHADVHRVELKLNPLPDDWRSPWVTDSESNLDENHAAPALGETQAEIKVESKPQHFRSLVYRFFRMPLAQKNEIVGALKLVDDDDGRLIDVERFKLQLNRARERNQLGDLDKMITSMENGA